MRKRKKTSMKRTEEGQNIFNIKGIVHLIVIQGRIQEFVQGGGLNFFFTGGAQHLFGPENPLESIDFTGPGGA